MQYPFELFSVTAEGKTFNFNGVKVDSSEHLAEILKQISPSASEFLLKIRTAGEIDIVNVDIDELAVPKYPFKLHSIAPIIRGEVSERDTIIYPNTLIENEEQLRDRIKDTSSKEFEVAYFDASKQKLVMFRLENDAPIDVSSLPKTSGLYPFRLIAITPIIDGCTDSSLETPYPHIVIEDAKHLSTYIAGSEHDTLEITYCDINGFKKKYHVVNKSDLAVDKKEVDTRSYNVGASDYAKHKIQPWDIWLEYNLGPWDADIIKRVLRTKNTDGRRLDYEKIIHICKERIRQIDNEKI